MQVRRWLIFALAGSIAGAGAIGAQAAEPDPNAVVVIAKRTLMSAPASPAIGSGFVAGGELFDEQGETKTGDGYSHCGVVSVTLAVPPSVTAHCTSVFRLPDGELHLSGMRTYRSIATGFDDAKLAVVGGTGAYADVRGDGTVTRESGETVGYRFSFNLVTE